MLNCYHRKKSGRKIALLLLGDTHDIQRIQSHRESAGEMQEMHLACEQRRHLLLPVQWLHTGKERVMQITGKLRIHMFKVF